MKNIFKLDDKICAGGTSLAGYLGKKITARQIQAVFGPGRGGDGEKVQYEWIFSDDGQAPFTIYDYKDGGDLDTPYDWHIGAMWGQQVASFRQWFLSQVLHAS